MKPRLMPWLTSGLLVLMAPAAAAEPLPNTETLVNERCATCHGAQGQSISPIFPSLAGQNKAYLIKQLADFKAGRRNSETMTPQVADLDDAAIAGLAEFFSARPARVNRASDADLLAVGRYIYQKGNRWSDVPACASCHGDAGHGTERLPRLAGQNARYLLTQLKEFNQRRRSNDNEIMHLVASRLTEMETQAVADYLAQLP